MDAWQGPKYTPDLQLCIAISNVLHDAAKKYLRHPAIA